MESNSPQTFTEIENTPKLRKIRLKSNRKKKKNDESISNTASENSDVDCEDEAHGKSLKHVNRKNKVTEFQEQLYNKIKDKPNFFDKISSLQAFKKEKQKEQVKENKSFPGKNAGHLSGKKVWPDNIQYLRDTNVFDPFKISELTHINLYILNLTYFKSIGVLNFYVVPTSDYFVNSDENILEITLSQEVFQYQKGIDIINVQIEQLSDIDILEKLDKDNGKHSVKEKGEYHNFGCEIKKTNKARFVPKPFSSSQIALKEERVIEMNEIVTMEGLEAALAVMKYPHYLWMSGHPLILSKARILSNETTNNQNEYTKRLSSFVKGENLKQCKWNNRNNIQPEQLVAAGFSYDGDHGWVSCHSCGRSSNTDEWSYDFDDDNYAMKKHTDLCCECGFVKRFNA